MDEPRADGVPLTDRGVLEQKAALEDRRWVGVAALLFAASLVVDLAAGYGVDDAWFLQVVDRFLSGDSLYRDVALGVTPLSVYATAPLAALTGSELIVVKVLCGLTFAASAVTALAVCTRVGGLRGRELWLVALPMAALGVSPLQALYSPLALAGTACCLVAALAWLERGRRDRRLLVAAGIAAGLSVASKQSVGLATVAALLVVVVLAGRRERRPLRATAGDAGVAMATACAAALLPLVPVLLGGGLGELGDYGFSGKGAYVDRSSVFYLSGLRETFGALGGLGARDAAEGLVRVAAFTLAPAAFLALAAALLRGPRKLRPRLLVVAAFWAAAMTNVIPRADLSHVAPTAWASLMVLGCSLGALRERLPRGMLEPALAAGCAAAAVLIVSHVPELFGPRSEGSRLPHLRFVRVDPAARREAERNAARLAAARREGGPTFLLAPDAGVRYLLSGIHNPTPYDYPEVTTFGSGGEHAVIRRLRRADIRQVCVEEDSNSQLRPERVIAYVRQTMRPAGEAGCELFAKHD